MKGTDMKLSIGYSMSYMQESMTLQKAYDQRGLLDIIFYIWYLLIT